MWNRFLCWWNGHSYAVHHRLLNPMDDSITCSRCGQEVVFSDRTKWYVTKKN